MDERARWGRVRIATSWLLQGSPIEGQVLDRDADGVTVEDDRGVVRFLPWSSVGAITLNPKVEDDQPF